MDDKIHTREEEMAAETHRPQNSNDTDTSLQGEETPALAETPVANQQVDAVKAFTVKLFQSHWARSNTETFQVVAKDEEEALQQVRKEHLANKDLLEDDDNKWDLEVEEDIPVAPPKSEESSEEIDPAAGSVVLDN